MMKQFFKLVLNKVINYDISFKMLQRNAMINVMKRIIQLTLGDSITTTTTLGGDDQQKKDIMLIINYSNSHRAQCYPPIRLRNPSQCRDIMINPAITDTKTNIIEAHYNRLASAAKQRFDFKIMMPHVELLSRINGQNITHLYLEADPKYLDHPELQQQHPNLVLFMFESSLKQDIFSVTLIYCANLETLTLRNVYMSYDVEVPKIKNHPLRQLDSRGCFFTI